jgi:hypothetical protein
MTAPAGVTRYQLPADAARRRALAAASVRAVTSLAPVVLAIVLLRRLGWAPNAAFWAVVAALAALVLVRAFVAFSTMRRRLANLVVTLDDDAIRMDGGRTGWEVPRNRAARIVEVSGALGGLRVESEPDARTGVVFVVDVPRGGEGWADLRAAVARWRPIEQRGRRGPAVRVAMAALVVAGIFFLPFFLEDFVARSRLLAAAMVAATWLAMRAALRGR